MPERRTDLSRAELIAAASRRILDDPRSLEPAQRHEATVLLADLYATGLRHGITAEDWALVASLGTEVIDAIRLRDRVVDRAPLGPELPPARPLPTTSARGRGRQR